MRKETGCVSFGGEIGGPDGPVLGPYIPAAAEV